MKKVLHALSLLLVTVILSVSTTQATHLTGGEITWKCVMQGGISKYQFKVTVYVDCQGFDPGGGSLVVYNLPGSLSTAKNPGLVSGGNTIALTQLGPPVSTVPECSYPAPTPLICDPNNQGAANSLGTVVKFTYVSGLIDFFGINPPADANSPIVFTWGTCCRDDDQTVQNILLTGEYSMILRAKMFPYRAPGSTTPEPINQCFDNSPDFSEPPSALLYSSAQYFTFNNNAIDIDLDDLTYDYSAPTLSAALNGETNPPEATWKNYPIYNEENPLGLNPAYYSLNRNTGEFTFRPLNNGKYVSCFKVTAKKCDQVVCEVYRDFMAIILPPNASQNNNKFPSVFKPFTTSGGPNTSNYVELIAGDTLHFPIIIRDSLPGNTGLSPQQLTFTLNGVAMGTENASETGCPYPPCAMLSKANNFDFISNPGNKPQLITNLAGESFGYGFKNLPAGYGGSPGDTLWFYWATNCSNLDRNNACTGLPSALYNFVVTAQDNFCSVPGKTIRTFSVNLLPPDFYKSPPIRCINMNPNGTVHMEWGETTGDTNTFVRYDIYRGGQVIASLPNRRTFSYTDLSPGASPWDSTWYVRSVNSCGSLDEVYPAHPIHLKASFIRATQAKLSWNAIHTPKLSTSYPNYVLLRRPISQPNWTIISDGDGDSTDVYGIDNYNLCGDTTLYRVLIYDSLGCASLSNIDTVRHQQIFAQIEKDTVCFGDPNTIIIKNISGGIGPYTYSLKGPEGFPGSGVTDYDTVSYTFPTSGKKAIIFTITDSKGCKFEVVDTAIVLRVPEVKILKDSSCANGQVTFDFDYLSTDIALLTTDTPLWNVNNGEIFYMTSPASYGGFGTLQGKYPIQLTLFTMEYGKICKHRFTDTVVFGESKIEIVEDPALCYDPAEDTLHLAVTYMKPEPDHNAVWTLVNGTTNPIIKQANRPTYDADYLPLHLLKGYSDVTVSVSVDDPNGCLSYTEKNFHLAPYFDLEMDSVCIGDPAQIRIKLPSNADSGRYRYDWTFGTEVVSGVRDPQYVYLTEGLKYFTVTVTDTVNHCSKTQTDTFLVKQPMELDIDVTLACAGEPTTFYPIVQGSGVDTAWRWYIGDAFGAYRDTSYLENPVFLFPAGKGVYNVTLMANDSITGCWTTYTETMKVFNQPDVDFEVDENNCSGNLTHFISTVIGSSAQYDYQWDFGDGSPLSTEANPVHVFPMGTEYFEVTLLVTNQPEGCVVPLTKMVKVCEDEQTVIRVPELFSPGENNTLSIYFGNVENFEMKIYNRWGIEVFSTTDVSKQWDGKDKSGKVVPTGSYVYIIQGNGPHRKNLTEKGTITILN